MITLFYQTDIDIPNSLPYHCRETGIPEISSVKPTFISEYAKYLGIEIEKVTKKSWQGNTAYYHIEIDWIDAAMIWQNVFSYIDKDVIESIKDVNSNLRLLLWFPNEGFDLTMPRFIDIIDYCMKELEIPAGKVYFVFGDLNIKENYRLLEEKGYENINVLGLNSFEAVFHKECKILREIGFDKSFITDDDFYRSKNKARNKIFIFKNANPREHRIFFAGDLCRRNLLKYSYYSWLNRYFTPGTENIEKIVSKYTSKNQEETANCAVNFLENSPYVIDYDQNEIEQELNQRVLIRDHFLNSYFSFVTETTYDNTLSDVLFVTEKVYQPIVQYHPFLIAGCPGILDYLKSCGYETFPELFDETYDSQKDLKTRTYKILENIENICKMDRKKLHDIYYSNYFQQKLRHNRNHFFDLNTKNDWIHLFERLSND